MRPDPVPEPIPLESADLASCLALSIEADWNQTEADWRLVLRLGRVFGLRRGDGRLIATAAVLPYEGRFAWICMVLVTPAERRRGHATRLLNHCVGELARAGLRPGLDATPAGREVYRKLGFQDVYPLTRLAASGARPAAPRLAIRPPRGTTLGRLTPAMLAQVATFDAQAFGAARREVLADLLARVPDRAYVALRCGEVVGHVLARDGRAAIQIGPLVAADETTAIALAARAITPAPNRAFIDVPDTHAALRRALAARGFQAQRPFIRMLMGSAAPVDDARRVFAVAGPELA